MSSFPFLHGGSPCQQARGFYKVNTTISPHPFTSPFPLTTTPLSLSLAAPPRFPDPYRWRIPRSTRSLIFSGWGSELPEFDDVITLIERAQLQIESEIDRYHGDRAMKKISTWTEENAHLVLLNDEGPDGVKHREALAFLAGLRLSGEVFGFWSSFIQLFDTRYTIPVRGKAQLSIARTARVKA
ncbi:MAG: hypothetical protein Q9166_000297 [cf. Caloplaca sp. 2 TL-2023]